MHWLVGLFLIKIIASAAYGFLFTRLPGYATNADTWRFFFAAVEEKQWLLQKPVSWLADIYTPRYAQDAGMLGTHNSLLNDLKDVLVVKLMTICNVLSGDRYYVNLIFFNYLFLFGQVALALVWTKIFQLKNAGLMLVAVCLWPSVLFWSSGFHRDGILVHCIGWACWICYTIWETKRVLLRQVLLLGICLGFIFLFRNYIALLLAGALLVGFAVNRWRSHAVMITSGSIALAIVGLLLMGAINRAYSLPAVLAQRQAEFLLLEGVSKIPSILLDGTWLQWAGQLPRAVAHAILVPPAFGPFKLKDLPFIFENLLWLVSIIPACMFLKKYTGSAAVVAFLATAMLLSVAVLCIIGYTIPFVLAIVRYKTLLWPFMAPAVVYWLYHKLRQWVPVLRHNT
ncbi:MAG TPA: hypothetical protein VLC98_07840 [Phnomibacter sp.]|nr:hypothetical protein [Phnomibacter sp.]